MYSYEQVRFIKLNISKIVFFKKCILILQKTKYPNNIFIPNNTKFELKYFKAKFNFFKNNLTHTNYAIVLNK